MPSDGETNWKTASRKCGNDGIGFGRLMASSANILAPLLAALRDLTAWLQKSNVPHVLIGGAAVAIVGRPRLTADVDAVVLLPDERWQAFLTSGASFGFEPRKEDAVKYARMTRMLLLRHDASGIEIDISMGAIPFESEMIARATVRTVSRVSLRIPSPEDLIIT